MSLFSTNGNKLKPRDSLKPLHQHQHQHQQTVYVQKSKRNNVTFDPRDVPYPINYDYKIASLDVLDHIFALQARKNNITWVDFNGETPLRSLDIGCGTGDWIIEAAKQWKDCHFVGLDIIPSHPNVPLLKLLGISERVRWINANFLTERLPFDDNYFDHVHVYRIGWGVAEDMWDKLFEEIARVLRPGGAIEIGEEDILFPILPKSYTIKLKSRPPQSNRPSLEEDEPTETGLHAHALLESLYYGVFASRKINCRPTSIIPHYLNIHFRHVICTPNVELPMPPPPVSRQQLRRISSDNAARLSATKKVADPASSTYSSSNSSPSSSSPSPLSEQFPSQRTSATSLTIPDTTTTATRGDQSPFKVRRPVTGSFEPVDPACELKLLPPRPIDLNNRNLAIHLNSSFRRIIACKEAMWDELCRRMHLRETGGPDMLRRFGWDDVDGEPAHKEPPDLGRLRARFDQLLQRFESDMLHRTALADAIESNLGWKKPPPDPLTKHERTRQKEVEHAITLALQAEPEELEQAQISRSFRGFIGFKGGRKR